jgi:PAS domain S-box-containing protein
MNTSPSIDRSTTTSVNDIQFEDIFNLKDIQNLQDLFSKASGVASLITHPDGRPITNPSNFCRLCEQIIRKTEKGLANCYKSDAMIGRYHPSGAIIWPCLSSGLWDAGTSISIGGRHIANWLIGQVRNEALDKEKILAYADEIGADREEFSKALSEIPVMSLEQFTNVANMLHAFANELSEKGYNNFLLINQISERDKAIKLLLESIETQKQNAAIIEKEETLMNCLMDNLPDRIYFKDKESRFLRFNKAMEVKHVLLQSGDAEGMTDFDLFSNEHAIQAFNDEQEIIQTGNPIVNIEEKETYTDGKILWVQTSKMPLRNKEGNIIGTFGISRDITKRKLAEEALKNALHTTETILESIHNGILVVNHKGKVIKTNARFAEMWHISEDIIASKDDKKILNFTMALQSDPDEFIATISALYKNTGAESFDLIHFKDGRIFERISKPITLVSEEKGRVWSFLDITERKKNEMQLQRNNERIAAQNEEFQQINEEFQQINEELNHANFELIGAKEKAEESDRLKSAFLANMSHEIRTPMNGILGFADLLKEPDLSGDERQEYIAIIEKSGLRMLNIINDLIDISKVESGQMEIFYSEINVNEQIEYIFNFFKPEVHKKGMELLFQVGLKDEDAVIRTDREKLYAVLTNLVKNAIKYSDAGSIELGYTLKDKFLVYYIKDTGIGIPESKKEAIFNRFIQADISDKRAFQGAGLGLAISKSYVEMLGGHIWVESIEGKGSTFYFTIPYHT